MWRGIVVELGRETREHVDPMYKGRDINKNPVYHESTQKEETKERLFTNTL